MCLVFYSLCHLLQMTVYWDQINLNKIYVINDAIQLQYGSNKISGVTLLKWIKSVSAESPHFSTDKWPQRIHKQLFLKVTQGNDAKFEHIWVGMNGLCVLSWPICEYSVCV